MADARAAIAAQLSDLGYGPAQVAGIIGNLQHESSLDPNAVGDNGTSFGLAQWRGDRLNALHDFAAKNGSDPADIPTQIGFLHKELQGPESTAREALTAATTPGEAATAFMHFERPKGYSVDNPAGGLGANARINNAIAFAGGEPLGTADYSRVRRPVGTALAGGPPGILGQTAASLAAPDKDNSDPMGILARNAPGQPAAHQREDDMPAMKLGGLLSQSAPRQARPFQLSFNRGRRAFG
jgi:hypothetical protein